jgi:hypothetical protein
MMWKRILVLALGAGLLGAAASESNASALTCDTAVCPFGCECNPYEANVGNSTSWVTATGWAANGTSSSIKARRQALAATSTNPAGPRTVDYEVVSIGSTYQSGYLKLSCYNTPVQTAANLTAASAGSLTCPAGSFYTSARVGINTTYAGCRPEMDGHCIGD